MLRWLHRLVSGPNTDGADRVRRDLDRRLREEVHAVRVAPSRDLRRRTLAALQQATWDADAFPLPARGLRGAYAAAGGLLALAATVAVLRHPVPLDSSTPGPVESRDDPITIVIGIDTTRFDAAWKNRVQQLEASWEAPLVAEARLIMDDARDAGSFVLARLPMPQVRIERR
ncbi:MAG: hypothetical protein ACYS0G_10240 [Planctomycetota bacterium]|jgi:hypothetical protein